MLGLKLPQPNVPLWVRLGVPISMTIALAIALISFLNHSNYEKTYRQLNVSRITVVARDLRQAIEVGLNVGLAPKNNTQLDKALAASKDHTEGLRFAVVIDAQGKRLVEVGGAAPNQGWLKRLEGIGEESSWLGEDADTYQVGLPYRNSFGITVGAVILGYDKAAIDRATAGTRLTLFANWLAAAVLLTVLTLLGVWWITRRLESELAQAEGALADPLSGASIPPLQLPLLGPQIERGISDFVRQSHAVQAAIAEVPKRSQ